MNKPGTEIKWIPAYWPWPVSLCRVAGCTNQKWLTPGGQVRAWCVFHARCYDLEAEILGGAKVLWHDFKATGAAVVPQPSTTP